VIQAYVFWVTDGDFCVRLKTIQTSDFHTTPNENMCFKAISIGSIAARRILKLKRFGRVHSVFRRVVNILTDNNQLISVVREDVGRGPINIVIRIPEDVNLPLTGVKKNCGVIKIDESIIIGNNALIISTKDAQKWPPQKLFRDSLQSIEKIRENLVVVKETVDSYGSLDGLGQLIDHVNNEHFVNSFAIEKLNQFARGAFPHILGLERAIKTGNLEGIRRNVVELIGLGPGLTPSADDVLCGLMISFVLMAENLSTCTCALIAKDFFSEVVMNIVSCVAGRTTLISEECLRLASVGEANESVINLVKRILMTEMDEVKKATMDVLTIGGSSGTDIVFGIFLGTQFFLDAFMFLRSQNGGKKYY
jgi:hypothetical protein